MNTAAARVDHKNWTRIEINGSRYLLVKNTIPGPQAFTVGAVMVEKGGLGTWVEVTDPEVIAQVKTLAA